VIACVSGCTSGLRGELLEWHMYTCRVLEIKHALVCLAENCTITGWMQRAQWSIISCRYAAEEELMERRKQNLT
jgi:hypothetical protein